MRKVFRTYKLSDSDKENLKVLKSAFPNLSMNMLRAFYSRGITTVEDLELALNGSAKDLLDPSVLKGCNDFINYITQIIGTDSKVVISGDYDTDGCVGTIILMKCLSNLGMNVSYYVNDRFTDGYGLSGKSMVKILDKYPDVKTIITVDNGISSVEAVDYCNSLGIDVLITDHHKVPKVLPSAKVIIDPLQSDCTYQSKNICGAVVVWKVMYALYSYLKLDMKFITDLFDLIAVATVGDQMTLTGESRIIVKEGLKIFNSNPRVQFKILMERLKVDYVDSTTIGYYISPLFNCISRLEGSADLIIDTFLSDNINEITYNIDYMFAVNDKRKSITASQVEKAFTLFDNDNLPNIIVIYDKSFTEGIIGLVAGRITEKFNRPSIVFCDTEDGVLKGSGRSVKPVNIYDLSCTADDLFINYGGHEFAIGCSIKFENLDSLRDRLESQLSDLTEDSFFKEILIDSIIKPEDVDINICSLFKVMEPYGYGFSKPRFLLRDFNVDLPKSNNNKCGSPFVGNDGSTLRLLNYNNLTVMMFKYADRWRELGYPTTISCVGEPALNEFNGKVTAQFIVEKDYIIK